MLTNHEGSEATAWQREGSNPTLLPTPRRWPTPTSGALAHLPLLIWEQGACVGVRRRPSRCVENGGPDFCNHCHVCLTLERETASSSRRLLSFS